MKHLGLHAFMAILLTTISATATAGNTYYRWVDSEGNPVHSDRPPPSGTNYEVVSTGTNKSRKVSSDEGAVPAVSDTSKKDEFEGYEQARTEAPAKNPELCKGAKENLNTLETIARVRIKNEAGEYHYLTPEEKESQKETARELIKTYCE